MKIINKKIFSEFSRLRLNNSVTKLTSIMDSHFYYYNRDKDNLNGNYNMFYENIKTGDFYYIKHSEFVKHGRLKDWLFTNLNLIGVNKEAGDEK